MEFLGHRLTSEGIGAQPEKVDALQGWKTPFTNAKQVKSFLGAFAWHQGYIAHFATLAAPLFALTSAKKEFAWTPECEDAVRRLKEAMNSAPVLVRWRVDLPTRVVTDASKVGIGAALEQRHSEGWRPVAFWSRKLKDPGNQILGHGPRVAGCSGGSHSCLALVPGRCQFHNLF